MSDSNLLRFHKQTKDKKKPLKLQKRGKGNNRRTVRKEGKERKEKRKKGKKRIKTEARNRAGKPSKK